MPVFHIVRPEMLSDFKEPFGTLIEGSFSETMNALKEIVEREKPSEIISVGDTVSRNLHKYHMIPHVSITDNQSMRKKLRPKTFPGKRVVKVKNPQGSITNEAILEIQLAIQSADQTQIVVEGEEDLLTLVAVLYAPLNAIVVYGQPSKGVVLVKVTPKKRAEAQRILNAMKTVEEKKG
jgi:uncharacterized protein (UPF0218 family)